MRRRYLPTGSATGIWLSATSILISVATLLINILN